MMGAESKVSNTSCELGQQLMMGAESKVSNSDKVLRARSAIDDGC